MKKELAKLIEIFLKETEEDRTQFHGDGAENQTIRNPTFDDFIYWLLKKP